MNERYEKGFIEMQNRLGEKTVEYIRAIEEVAPLFARVNVEFAFGDIYGGEKALDKKTGELITIGALTVMGYAGAELRIHIGAALRLGVSKEEIVETITQMIAYCGFPAATNAILIAKEVFKEID
jgi:4-carboxymuconolactone decarboxylase